MNTLEATDSVHLVLNILPKQTKEKVFVKYIDEDGFYEPPVCGIHHYTYVVSLACEWLPF